MASAINYRRASLLPSLCEKYYNNQFLLKGDGEIWYRIEKGESEVYREGKTKWKWRRRRASAAYEIMPLRTGREKSKRKLRRREAMPEKAKIYRGIKISGENAVGGNVSKNNVALAVLAKPRNQAKFRKSMKWKSNIAQASMAYVSI